jgi:hypothetical protein
MRLYSITKLTRQIVAMGLLGLTSTSYALELSDIGIREGEGYSLTTGLEYASGDYGTSDTTDLWTVPIGLDYVKGPYSAGVSTSFMSATSNGAIITSSMGGMSRSKNSVNSSSGIGDINLYASYKLPEAKGSDITYHVTARLKLGTADADKGLGTGENDYAIEGGLVTLYKEVIVFASVGYQISGDSATINYHDVLYGSGGATYPIGKGRDVGAMLSLSQAITPGYDAPADVTLFLNQELDKKRDLYFYLLFGLSDGSPDFGAGANITIQL